jgi:hypothetical protein
VTEKLARLLPPETISGQTALAPERLHEKRERCA